jgi:hypothetical protein
VFSQAFDEIEGVVQTWPPGLCGYLHVHVRDAGKVAVAKIDPNTLPEGDKARKLQCSLALRCCECLHLFGRAEFSACDAALPHTTYNP